MIIKSNLFIFHPYNQIEITTFFWTLHIGVFFYLQGDDRITNLTLGSLFDGIGVFPLAAQKQGITLSWAGEIEKAPISYYKETVSPYDSFRRFNQTTWWKNSTG